MGLPDEQREVLVPVCAEDLTYQDTAEVLGIPIGTVMSRLGAGQENLAEDAENSGPSRSRQHAVA